MEGKPAPWSEVPSPKARFPCSKAFLIPFQGSCCTLSYMQFRHFPWSTLVSQTLPLQNIPTMLPPPCLTIGMLYQPGDIIAWIPPDVVLGYPTKSLHFGFIRHIILFDCDDFGKLHAVCHVPLSEEGLSSGHCVLILNLIERVFKSRRVEMEKGSFIQLCRETCHCFSVSTLFSKPWHYNQKVQLPTINLWVRRVQFYWHIQTSTIRFFATSLYHLHFSSISFTYCIWQHTLCLLLPTMCFSGYPPIQNGIYIVGLFMGLGRV